MALLRKETENLRRPVQLCHPVPITLPTRIHAYSRTIHVCMYTWDYSGTHSICVCVKISVYVCTCTLFFHMCTYTCTANPTWGVIFESSKLKARTSLLPRFSEKRPSSFELWNSIRKCHPKWDRLYVQFIHVYKSYKSYKSNKSYNSYNSYMYTWGCEGMYCICICGCAATNCIRTMWGCQSFNTCISRYARV